MNLTARRPITALTALALCLVLGAPSLLFPFGRDQAEYAYTANAALNGQVVYRDVFCVKPPLTPAVHAIALTVFGHSMLSIRILDLIWQTATALTILAIARRLSPYQLVHVLAVIFYLLTYYSFRFPDIAQTDGFISLPIALAILLFIRAIQTPCPENPSYAHGDGAENGVNPDFSATSAPLREILFCGFLIGLAAMFKYPIAILLPLLAARWLCTAPRSRLFGAALMVLGFAISISATLAALALHGGLRDFLDISLNYIPRYNLAINHDRGLLGSIAINLVGAWVDRHSAKLMTVMTLAALIQGWRLRRDRVGNVVLLWLVAAVVHLAAQNKFYPYHWLPLCAPVAILLASALPDILGTLESRCALRPAVACTLMMLAVAGVAAWRHASAYRALARVAFAGDSLDSTYRGIPDDRYQSVRGELDAAAYLRQHTQPGEPIFLWGFDPALYFLSDRPCASRFIYNFPLYGACGWPELQQRCLKDLDKARPVYFVVARNDAMNLVTGTDDDSETALTRIDCLREFVASNYRPEASIGRFTLHRRAQGSPVAQARPTH